MCYLKCHPLPHLYLTGGCAAEDSLVCTLTKEPSVCHGWLSFLFVFSVEHMKCLEVRCWKFQQRNSDFDWNTLLSL